MLRVSEGCNQSACWSTFSSGGLPGEEPASEVTDSLLREYISLWLQDQGPWLLANSQLEAILEAAISPLPCGPACYEDRILIAQHNHGSDSSSPSPHSAGLDVNLVPIHKRSRVQSVWLPRTQGQESWGHIRVFPPLLILFKKIIVFGSYNLLM